MSASIAIIDFHGLPALRLSAANGAEAVVTTRGAQLVSWRVAGAEQLYLSERADFSGGAPIRGGVPVVFPQFGHKGPLARHGFARIADWQVAEQRCGEDFATATWQLSESDATRASWSHPFRAELTVALEGRRLDIELAVENTGADGLSFTAALHTYLRVAEVEYARLVGLQGLRYLDQSSGADCTDGLPALVVEDEIDRVYRDAPAQLLLRDGPRSLKIESENFPDVVVWNPWEQACAKIADMPAAGFRRMLAVEAAAVHKPVVLAAGQLWWGRQTLTLL